MHAMTPIMTIAGGASLIFALMAPTVGAAEANCLVRPYRPIEVEVRTNRADRLNLRLMTAIRAAYAACGSGYVVTKQGDSGRLTVTIVGRVGMQRFGGRNLIAYRVDYLVYGARSGQIAGDCSDDDIQVCARSIVKGSPPVSME